jgi:hypothetical protein
LEVLFIFPFAGETSFAVDFDFDLSLIKFYLEFILLTFDFLSDATEEKLFWTELIEPLLYESYSSLYILNFSY